MPLDCTLDHEPPSEGTQQSPCASLITPSAPAQAPDSLPLARAAWPFHSQLRHCAAGMRSA